MGVMCASVVEVAFGMLAVFSPEPALYIVLLGTTLCVSVSAYGTVALHRSGHCGWGGRVVQLIDGCYGAATSCCLAWLVRGQCLAQTSLH